MWTIPLLLLSGGSAIVEQALSLGGSPMGIGDFDQVTLGSLNMAFLKPLWEEVWIGIFGIYLAYALRRGEKYAWTLSLFWGIMLITNAVIQGAYELIVLNWSNACIQTYLFLLLGGIAVASLLATRKRYFALN